jgi:hypothetical protein
MILGRSNNVQRKTKHIMLQNTPTKGEIRQKVKFNDRLFLKNQTNAGIKDFFKKIGRGAKKVWNKIKKPITKVWDFMTEGPGNALLTAIPKVGPILAPALKTVDDVIDTGVEIVKDIKKTKDTVQRNVKDSDRKLLDDVDTDKLKQDFDWVKEKTKQVYDKVKPVLTAKERASAIENAGMINMELMSSLKPMQRGRIKRLLPYAPYIQRDKHSRLTIPKKIRDIDPEAPKTLDNTGGRLFNGKCASGIKLDDSDSGRMFNSGLKLNEPESGRLFNSSAKYVSSRVNSGSSDTKKISSKEEIYKKLFGKR